MFAVIKTGGKQYTVRKDEFIHVEKIEAENGSEIVINDVLLIGENEENIKLGNPIIKGASVKAEVVNQIRDDKIIVFKKKRRQGYKRTNGHRQDLTILKIKEIQSA